MQPFEISDSLARGSARLKKEALSLSVAFVASLSFYLLDQLALRALGSQEVRQFGFSDLVMIAVLYTVSTLVLEHYDFRHYEIQHAQFASLVNRSVVATALGFSASMFDLAKVATGAAAAALVLKSSWVLVLVLLTLYVVRSVSSRKH